MRKGDEGRIKGKVNRKDVRKGWKLKGRSEKDWRRKEILGKRKSKGKKDLDLGMSNGRNDMKERKNWKEIEK